PSGLGNDLHYTILPRNQIPFWVDTICCPSEAEEATGLRIFQIRKTYMDADKVPGLDSNLQTADSSSHVEQPLQILFSRRFRPLSGLQEGALTNALYFPFSDGPYVRQPPPAQWRSM